MGWENLLETLDIEALSFCFFVASALHGGLDCDVGLVGCRYKGSKGWHKTSRADHWCHTTYTTHHQNCEFIV